MKKIISRVIFLLNFIKFIINNKTVKDINLLNYKSIGIGLSNTLKYRNKYIIKIKNQLRERINVKKYNGTYDGDFSYDTENKFKREFIALNKLSKIGLSPTPIEYGSNYIIIEFINNSQTLDKYIISTKDFNIFSEVLEKINILHNMNIFHGDLNLGNIIIDKNKKIYFIDFESLLKDELSKKRKIEIDFAIFENKMKKFHPEIYKKYNAIFK